MTDPPPHPAPPHGPAATSPWVERFAGLVPAGGAVLDLAAGGGRHSLFFRRRGHPVVAVDRDAAALRALAADDPGLSVIEADLEAPGAAWPPGAQRFAGIVVTNYLHRQLFDAIRGALASGGALIYETFAVGNERFGKPSNSDFLLRPGELLDLAAGFHIVAYEDLEIAEPRPAMVQRIAAVRS